MYVGTKLTQLCVLSARNKSLAWNGNYWVFAPNKDVHQSGEQFDAPNMLLPSAACLPAWSPCAVARTGTVRFLLPSHAKQEHSTLFRRDLFSWRLGLGQAVSGGSAAAVFFLYSGQLCRAHTNCWCISACIPFWTQKFINSYSPLIGAASRRLG